MAEGRECVKVAMGCCIQWNQWLYPNHIFKEFNAVRLCSL